MDVASLCDRLSLRKCTDTFRTLAYMWNATNEFADPLDVNRGDRCLILKKNHFAYEIQLTVGKLKMRCRCRGRALWTIKRTSSRTHDNKIRMRVRMRIWIWIWICRYTVYIHEMDQRHSGVPPAVLILMLIPLFCELAVVVVFFSLSLHRLCWFLTKRNKSNWIF